jgi:diaminopimelate epimerase
MSLAFTKMHGLGNDFVVVDGIDGGTELDTDAIRGIADRDRGVGCDQLLLLERADSSAADARMRIFNADGGEVEQCGNGARCVAQYLWESGRLDGDRIRLATRAGVIETELLGGGWVAVAMGEPVFAPGHIPFVADAEAEAYTLEVEGRPHEIGAVSLGNPHAVLRYSDVTHAPVPSLGPLIEHHARFPNGANVGFAQHLDSQRLRLRVWERGSGETAACGTAACAAVAIGRRQDLLARQVNVTLDGGELVIAWDGPDNPLWMTGPTATVFDGSLRR